MTARTLNRLKEVSIRSDKLRAGRHSDGGGLYLNVTRTGSRSWVFIWKRQGKATEIGFGAYPAVPLAKARELARSARELVAAGGNPKDERDKEAEPTFKECTARFLASMESAWTNAKHRAQWRSTLGTYAAPLADKRVSEIETADVLKALNPIWKSRPETASRVRGRIERVLNFAKANGWRSGENPAAWRNHLKNVLPGRRDDSRGHHAAMPYKDVPEFMAQLCERRAMAAYALRFLILTAARTSEVLDATWREIDMDAATWTIPGKRMKAKKEHSVPLSDAALAILSELREAANGDLIFPGMKRGRPLSNMAFAKLLERMDRAAFTAHGFRSSFRDWIGDETSFPRELAEHALAHRVGNATERAYRRNTAPERRRAMMQAWADYCHAPQEGAKVVALRR